MTPWSPTEIVMVLKRIDTSTTPLVVMTDDGKGYAKTLGNREGPSALACELLGTMLAELLGLATLEWEVVDFPAALRCDLGHGCVALPGPAFVTREVRHGRPWAGTSEDLELVDNIEDLAALVILDTWLRNPDRYFRRVPPRKNLGNVYLAPTAGRRAFRIMAMDFTACLRQDTELSKHHLTIGCERQTDVFGLFPEFVPHVTRRRVSEVVERLEAIEIGQIAEAVAEIPRAWLPAGEVRDNLAAFVSRRARFLVASIESWLDAECSWQPELPLGSPS